MKCDIKYCKKIGIYDFLGSVKEPIVPEEKFQSSDEEISTYYSINVLMLQHPNILLELFSLLGQ